MKRFTGILGGILSCFLATTCFLKADDTASEINLALNRAVYQSSAANYDNTGHLATDGSQDTFWQSAPGAEQWVYVDLGQSCAIDRVRLSWGAHASQTFQIQLSDDANNPEAWKSVRQTTAGTEDVSDISFPKQTARYVRLLMQVGGEQSGYSLREFEVHGVASASISKSTVTPPTVQADGTFLLDDEPWKVQRDDFVKADPPSLSSPGANTQNWLPGLIPGTVLTSYLKAGAIPDPRYGDQQFQVSEDFFNNHDFWYRTEFTVPDSYQGREVWLNFDGINWKAEVYLNGTDLGHIDGAFIRGAFDITKYLQQGKPNVLAVLIHKMGHPGPTDHKIPNGPTKNGSVIGLDSPTYVASTKWNWVPSIRGRDIGIWSHVYLRATGGVRLADPFVITDLTDDCREADLTIKTTLVNDTPQAQSTLIDGTIGNLHFSQKVDLAAGETKEIALDKSTNPELIVSQPRLWWPNGYGDQPLYKLHLDAKVGDTISDQRDVTFGIRKLSCDVSNNILKISVNGHQIMSNGGNWGMAEAMLLYNAQDFDTAVHLHKDMNLVMIRNWVGQTARDEFYSACDKYGILVWNDFWLANPGDGSNPADSVMFISNMRDKIAQIRNHPSLALYCGRNEGNPPKDLDDAMRQATTELDGTRYYISHSAASPHSVEGLVTGFGPYEPKSPDWYFKNRGTTLHSELGIVCVPTLDSLRLMMPEKDLWPIGDMWALHDYFQPRCRDYTKLIDASYGPATDAADFCEKAQMLNMETSKAMMECWRSNRGSGGLIWMSQPAWPSLICQLYDYYLNPTAAYFGVKKACEPLHILWNPNINQVQVANDTLQDFTHLAAEASIFDLAGNSIFHQDLTLDAKSGTTSACFPLDFSHATAPVQFIRLKLTNGDKVLSDNFYWHGGKGTDFTALGGMPHVKLTGQVENIDSTSLQVTVANPNPTIALMVCLKVVRDNATGDRVLPIYYEDNYFSLLPNETKTVSIQFGKETIGDSKPVVVVQGWNVDAQRL